MNKPLYFIFSIVLTASLQVKAQEDILKQCIDKINSYKSISYTSITQEQAPWGDRKDVVQTYQGKSGDDKLQFELINSNEQSVFDGENFLLLNQPQKFYKKENNYRWQSNAFVSTPLFALVPKFTKALKTPQKISQLQDTVVGKNYCYHIKITASDTTKRQKRSYDICDIYLNKKTLLPAFFEEREQGFLSKGGVESSDVFTFDQQNTYLNYKINQVKNIAIDNIKIPEGYITLDELNNRPTKSVPTLLTAGTVAPDWTLQDVKGNRLSNKQLKGKVVLIDFCGLGCGPCIMTEPVMARLREKYKNADVKIVTVDIDKGAKSAITLTKKTKYQVYANGNVMYANFNGNGIPLFYLVDKQGVISKNYSGYGDDLEQNLTADIDKIIK